ncbi:hypothetical protein HYG81_16705 [Natrinema zhouii]|uniref:Blue (type 1) copper domain-containing protein n=1 Tax=Natrinema zhouii TaxID=1710539 RepID=A0A7D6GK17_9EURY|nr:plastocyanin/azurin family copper-binding protein [Natrinema zhouii]QLK25700.1 hypothetical protein HYG81_16705 [Natrinema zhouii]
MIGNRSATRRRWLRSCGSVGVVGLAGCVSDTSDGSDTTDGSDRNTRDLAFPPGLSADGLDDSAALFDAHSDAVSSMSFTGEYTAQTRRTDEATGESVTLGTESFDIRAEPDAERVEKITYDGWTGREVDKRIYIEGDYGATSDGGRMTHRTVEEVLETSLETMAHWVQNVDGDYDGPETTETGDVHAISVTAIDTQRLPGEPVDEEGTILVDEDGRIHSVRIRKTTDREDVRLELDLEFECSGFGETTVAEPEWVDGLENTGHERVEIEPGTAINLAARVPAWAGVEPAAITGLENPTLVLEAGESYSIGWSTGDGAAHNIQLVDENDEVVDDYRTEVVADPADGQRLDFTATEEIAGYVCEPHAPSMNGDIEVR